jgi:hypothetical protein
MYFCIVGFIFCPANPILVATTFNTSDTINFYEMLNLRPSSADMQDRCMLHEMFQMRDRDDGAGFIQVPELRQDDLP